ncbi:MAG TPA: HAD family hydrolase [Actinomycetes bacterium]|jgi:phosphoglycolate phosphatase-like HAD superfamily hydrolase|nr:HAD family hydrolase [Actinomycetes bacterium]
MRRRLVLWDIDGTLVSAAGVGQEVFAQAFRAVMGRDPAGIGGHMVAMAGRTDHEIALEFLAVHDVADGEAHLPAFTSALAAAMGARSRWLAEHGHALPGAEAALAALGREPGVVQSLLTGNIEPNAAVKLAAFGLDAYVDFEVGGFGSDGRHRPSLVEVARRKARAKYGVAFDPSTTVLVGDTPLDVAAGRQSGARVVAVATGPFDARDLHAAGADVVLPDLRDTGAVLRAVLAGAAGPH